LLAFDLSIQMPQLLHQMGLTRLGVVGITQPRRVAAITIAHRVAEEMAAADGSGCGEVGDFVGYNVRFDDRTNKNTRIKFLTDGMLLREIMLDSSLSSYSALVLDEAHERTVASDVLFALVKQLLARRPQLKLIIMSATLEAQLFADYFGAKIVFIEGRRFPVDIHYTLDAVSDYVEGVMTCVMHVHDTQPEGDILAFLTGQDEIEATQRLIEQRMLARSSQTNVSAAAEGIGNLDAEPNPSGLKLFVAPLFASLNQDAQVAAFKRTPSGCRKVVLATNIAESSVTISGIRYVVDPCLVKARVYVPNIGLEHLAVIPVSKAQARQRSGRAGREAAGKCFRLLQRQSFDELADSQIPEIQRARLTGPMLSLLSMGPAVSSGLQWITRPSKGAAAAAAAELSALGAVDSSGCASELGKKMAMFPLEPCQSRALLEAATLGCVCHLLSVVACMSVENLYYTPIAKIKEAAAMRARFTHWDGDHLTLLQIWRAYNDAPNRSEWCKIHYVSSRAMSQVSEVRQQLCEYCEQIGISTAPGDDADASLEENIMRCLLAGYPRNVAHLTPDGRTYRSVHGALELQLHPTSALLQRNPRPSVILYDELIMTSKLFARRASSIQQEWVATL
jgi:pre-mRNA-splicing factor ATP-dependent RNA helicase DHX16